jgi:hypothetical protein
VLGTKRGIIAAAALAIALIAQPAVAQGSWAGTCRTFNMTLNDGSSHPAMFKVVG